MTRLGVLVVLAVALAVGCGRAPSPDVGSPSPSTVAATPAGSDATLAPSPSGGLMELAHSPDPLVPGRYTRTGFSPAITFEVDGPWHAVQLYTGFFDVQQDVDTPDVIAVQFAKPTALYGADGAAVELADPSLAAGILGANPGLTVLETSASRIGGLDGFQVTVENAGSSNAQVMRVPAGPLSILEGRRLWIALFDTPDAILAIMIGGSVATWDAALATAEPVLESIEIGT